MFLATVEGEWPATKMASACLAEKALPDLEVPACIMTGVRWGEGWQMCGPGTV